MTATVTEAYARCEEITKAEARNFSYGIRLLPPVKRAALSAVYAFSRRIDDIGDESGPAAKKLAALADARADLEQISLDSPDPVLVALADSARRLPIRLEVFGELIDGVEADVRGVRYETFDDLVGYCRQVAGSIGRLSLGVYGGPDTPLARSRADALGVALQLTNILRDVREDLRNGRIYLPAADLRRHGVELRLVGGEIAGPQLPLTQLIRAEAATARAWYTDGLKLLPMLDPRSAACTAAMAGIYSRLLRRIAERPDIALTRRTSLPTAEKAAVAVTSLTSAALRARRP
jgi:phytoene synthase